MRSFLLSAMSLTVLALIGAADSAAAAPLDPALGAIPAKMSTALIANDAAAVRAACAGSATVVDEFAPYSWSGADACARWVAGFTEFAKQNKLSGFKATIGPKPFTDVTGDRAYLVAQVKFDALASGKPLSESGTWTFVFAKQGAAWKITSLAWGTLHR